MYFIDPYQRKNYNYYLLELQNCVNLKLFDDVKIFYGDEIFNELGLSLKWQELKSEIIKFNQQAKTTNLVKKIIIEYLKWQKNNDRKKYDEVIKMLEEYNK